MRTWLLAGFWLLWLFAAPNAAHAQEGRVTLDQYWALVDRSLDAIAFIEDEPQSDRQSALEGLVLEWNAIGEVVLPDGGVVTMEAASLVAQLRTEPADLTQIRQSLEALKRAQPTPPKAFDENDAASIQPILAQPEFQWQEPEPSLLQQWGERFFAWLNELLNKIFGNQNVDVKVSIPTTNLFSIFAILVFAVLMFFVMRSLLGSLVSESRLAGESESAEQALTAETALRRAQNLSRGGDYRSAVRFLYLSSLLLLEERGLLRYDRSKTNREVLRSVADQPNLTQPLQNIVEVFDQVWYGYESLDQDSYAKYEADVQQIKEQHP